jgi:hypothetical protein
LPCLCHSPLFATEILFAAEYRFPYMIQALYRTVYDYMCMNVLKLIALFSAFCRWVFVIVSAHCFS